MTFDSALHRAAVLVKSLPQAQSSKLLAQLDSTDLQTLFRKVRTLDPVAEADQLAAAGKLLEEAKTSKPLSTIETNQHHSQSDLGPFDFLLWTTEENQFNLLASEHPANIATVFTFLPTKVASAILNRFQPNVRVSILRRLCQLDDSEGQPVVILSNHLKSNLRKMLNSNNFSQVGIAVATKLLNYADPQARDSIIEHLDDQDTILATEIKNSVFEFQHFAMLSNSDIKIILKYADTSCWAPALKNANSKLRRKVLRNFAERPRTILGREIRSLKQLPSDTKQAAQTQLVQTVLQLAERGFIQIPVLHNETATRKAA